MGQHPDSIACAQQTLQLCRELGKNCLIDADAIAACRDDVVNPETNADGSHHILLTPWRRVAEVIWRIFHRLA